MHTAIDSAVLLDVLVPGAPHCAESEARLAQAATAGGLVVCPTVVAELSVHFAREVELTVFLRDTALRIEPFGLAALHLAGQSWRAYLRRTPLALADARRLVLADFLVGAHALVQADRLLTRDRGFYRACFPKLKIGP